MSNGNELKKASITDLPCLKIGQKQCLCEISCEDCIESHVLAEGYRKQSEGEWIWIRGRTYGEPACYCSECFEGWSEYGFDKFCPNCGAKMKGGAK